MRRLRQELGKKEEKEREKYARFPRERERQCGARSPELLTKPREWQERNTRDGIEDRRRTQNGPSYDEVGIWIKSKPGQRLGDRAISDLGRVEAATRLLYFRFPHPGSTTTFYHRYCRSPSLFSSTSSLLNVAR